jgi:PPOX class probable FMN-dependent enzyme
MDRPDPAAVDLSALYPAPSPLAKIKQIDHLDKHCRRFIELSPFLCLGSTSAEGKTDVSPRGDPAGFVKVLDDKTLAIPDRPGNNRIDSIKNLVDQPSVGMIFFIPGIEETLRVNGRAELSTDPKLLETMTVEGKTPKLAIVVRVEEAFLHCAKALRRSKLWDASRHQPRNVLPSLSQMILEQTKTPDVNIAEADARLEEAYKRTMY